MFQKWWTCTVWNSPRRIFWKTYNRCDEKQDGLDLIVYQDTPLHNTLLSDSRSRSTIRSYSFIRHTGSSDTVYTTWGWPPHTHEPLFLVMLTTFTPNSISIDHVPNDCCDLWPLKKKKLSVGQTPRLCNLPRKSYLKINVPYTGDDDLIKESR